MRINYRDISQCMSINMYPNASCFCILNLFFSEFLQLETFHYFYETVKKLSAKL